MLLSVRIDVYVGLEFLRYSSVMQLKRSRCERSDLSHDYLVLDDEVVTDSTLVVQPSTGNSSTMCFTRLDAPSPWLRSAIMSLVASI